MNDEQRAGNDEITLALQALNNPAASEAELDAAFAALTRLIPFPAPQNNFSGRVMKAVRLAPLPAGRKRLKARPPAPAVIGVASVSAVVLWSVMLSSASARLFIARVFELAIQVTLAVIRSFSMALDTWKWMDRSARVLTVVVTSSQMLSALIVLTFIGILSFVALTRLLSSSQREYTKW